MPVAATRAAATGPTSFLEGGVRVGLDGLLDDQPASFTFLTGVLRDIVQAPSMATRHSFSASGGPPGRPRAV